MNDETVRLLLLAQIPDELISFDESRQLLAAAPPPGPMPEHGITTTVEPYGELEFLKEQGVDTDSSANVALRNLRDVAERFTKLYRGRPVDAKATQPMLRALRALHRHLLGTDVSTEQAEFGWETLMLGCESLALTEGLSSTSLSFLTTAIRDAQKAPGSTSDSNFDKHGSWGGPAHEVPAATAAMYLFSAVQNSATRKLVKAAASDPFKPARSQVAQLVLRLGPDSVLMWQIAETIAASDLSSAVVSMFVNASLGYLFRIDAKRANKLLALGYDRARRARWTVARDGCEALYLWRSLLGEHTGDRAVRDVIRRRKRDPESIRKFLFQLRSFIRISELQKPSIALVARLTDDFLRDYRDLMDGKSASESVRKAIGSNLLELVSELYFALNAFELNNNSSAEPSSEDLALFDQLIGVYTKLSAAGVPAVVQRALETFDFFSTVRPSVAFDLTTAFIESGKEHGFQYEYMGAKLAVRLMEDFVAENRSVIESSASRREAFVRVLNAFSLWPDAVRLIYRFDEIFR